MWIKEEEEIAKKCGRAEDLDRLYFFDVKFSENAIQHLQHLKGRSVKKLSLVSCRGALKTVLPFILEEIKVEDLFLSGLSDLEVMITAQAPCTLKRLHLQGLFVTKPLFEALKQGLFYCQTLQHLVWNNDGLSSTVEAHELKVMLLNARKLKTLELWKHSFQDTHIAELLQSVHDHPSLLHLRISIKNLSNVIKAIVR